MEGEGSFACCWWECKLYSHYEKQHGWSSKKLKTELPYDPAVPLLSLYPKEISLVKSYRHSYIYYSIIHNSQDMEAN
jgi:hypothetical protein